MCFTAGTVHMFYSRNLSGAYSRNLKYVLQSELVMFLQPESMPLVPPLMIVLAKHPRVSQYDLSSVKRIMCGGAPLSPEIEEAAKKRLNNPLVQQGKQLFRHEHFWPRNNFVSSSSSSF